MLVTAGGYGRRAADLDGPSSGGSTVYAGFTALTWLELASCDAIVLLTNQPPRCIYSTPKHYASAAAHRIAFSRLLLLARPTPSFLAARVVVALCRVVSKPVPAANRRLHGVLLLRVATETAAGCWILAGLTEEVWEEPPSASLAETSGERASPPVHHAFTLSPSLRASQRQPELREDNPQPRHFSFTVLTASLSLSPLGRT